MSPLELARLWESHTSHEFAIRDTEATLDTMVEDAYVNHIHTMTCGYGKPAYGACTDLTHNRRRPVGRRYDLPFTHTQEMPWMLPGIAPTNRRVEVPLVAIVKFRDGKVAHEHIYWDQASVLKQIGLLTDESLPVRAAETADKVRNPQSTNLARSAQELLRFGFEQRVGSL